MVLLRGFQVQVEGGDRAGHPDIQRQPGQHLEYKGEDAAQEACDQKLQQIPQQETQDKGKEVLFPAVRQFPAPA